MPKIASLLLSALSVAECCRVERLDICFSRRVRRVLSRSGESGCLGAYNVSHGNGVSFDVLEGCEAEIVACPSCVISLTFRYINLSCNCGSGFDLFLHNHCRSDYVRITEPPYDEPSGVSFCGVHLGRGVLPKRLKYKSKTRAVRVSLFYSRSHLHAFTLDYISEPNRQLFIRTSDRRAETSHSHGFISSPFFPAAYPKDLVIEYFFVCKSLLTPSSDLDVTLQDDFNCRIQLMFTDFLLAPPSFMEFYEGSHRVHTASGTYFRLPMILTTNNSLAVRFFASGQNSVGFKAAFSFIPENVMKKPAIPATDCGGFVGDSGGTITMTNMVDTHFKTFYCVWLIQPSRSFFPVRSHLYVKVNVFLNFAGDAELEIRGGLTSESPLLETLRYPTSRSFQEHTIPAELGFYVTLRASFGPASQFVLSYAGFSLSKCFGPTEFLCRNFRCISRKLTCDGVDHCGDDSDESGLCNEGGPSRKEVTKWHTFTANYYFPRTKQISGSVVFLVGFLGLIFLSFALTAVYRLSAKTQRQRDLQDRLQAISDLQDSFSDEASIEAVVIDEPPSYEPPPSYEEVVGASASGAWGEGGPDERAERIP